MERYREYKDSGEQWMGEIPSHWDFLYLRVLSKENSIQNSEGNVTSQLQFKYGSIIKKDNQDVDSDVIDTISKYTIVLPGDIVINGLNLNYDFVSQRIGQVEELGVITSAYICLRPTNYANRKYLLYLLKAMDGIKLFHGMGTGVRMTLSYKELKNKRLPVPPLSEQTAMVAYLDRVTVQIDKAIAQQQRMIDLLNERKQIIIQHAVTKGLDPNAEMVDSGVEWIGKIPKGWKLYKLKHLLQAPLKYGANESASEYNETDPRYIRITDIDNEGNLKNNTVCTIPLHKALPYMLQKGDLLLARSGATVGKSYLFQEDYKACYAGYLIKACFSKKISPQFVYLYTQSASYSKWKDYILIQSTIQNISAEKYANLLIPTPPVEVQLSILKYLDPQLDKMNVTLANFNRKIEVLRERKQIIINEVVTGKVKVS